MRLGWLTSICILLLPLQSFLQTPCEDIGITLPLGFNTQLNIPDDGILDPGDEFCINFHVQNYNSVSTWEGAFAFDPTILEFLSFSQVIGVIDPIGVNSNQADNGVVSLVWFNNSGMGQSLPNGTHIFTLCFRAVGEPGDCSPLFFNDNFPFFPELLVSYEPMPGVSCTDTLLLLDGQESSTVKIACTELTIIDLKVCNSSPGQGGSISFSACGGRLPYSYELVGTPVMGTIFTDGQVVSLPTIPAGVHTIRITDSDGNVVTRNVNIENSLPIQFDTSFEAPICPESETGLIRIIDIRGGVPGLNGYTMEASTGEFFQNTYGDSLVRLANGMYSITITDDNGCEVERTFEINTPEIELDIQVDSATCHGSTDGSVCVIPSGGTPFAGGQYRINGQLATEFKTNMPFHDPNFFSIDNRLVVRVVDANGCIKEARIEIPVKEELEAEIVELIDVACKGDSSGSIRIRVLNSGRYNFFLTDAIGNFVNAIGSVINNNELFYNATLPAGFYNLRIRETTVGCQLDTFFMINEPMEELVVNSGAVTPDCNSPEGIAYVEVSGGVGTYDYNWDFDPGINNDSLAGLVPGFYMVTVSDEAGCTEEVIVEVPQGAGNVEIEIDVLDDLGCEGGEGTLQANVIANTFPDIVFQWTDIDGNELGTDNMLQITNGGEYILNAGDPGGNCTDSDTVSISASALFTFDIITTDPQCDGSSAGMISIENFTGGSGNFNCEWDIPGITDCVANNLTGGMYFITITDDAGCSVDTFVNLINAGSEFSFDIDITHPSCVDAIDGSISFTNFSGSTGPYDCLWEDPDIQGCPRTGLPAGIYPVTIVDGEGCELDTFVELTDPEPIELEVLATDIVAVSCFEGGDGQATVTITNDPSGTGNYNFVWSNPDDNDSGGLTDDATQLSAGENFVYAFDNNSCSSDTVFFDISEPAELEFDLDNTVIMSPSCVSDCDGSIELSITGGVSTTPYDFVWGDGSMGASRNNLCAGMYYVTVTDDNNCELIDSFEIEEPEELSLEIDENATVDLSCFGDNSGAIQIIASGGCGDFSYEWTNNVSDTQRAENLGAGTYRVTVTDGCGCSNTTEYTLTASEAIEANIIDPETPACFGGTSCIGVESVTGGVGNNYTYSINFGNRIDIDSCVEVIAGNYTISVFDAAGCAESYTVTVEQPPMIEVDLGEDIELELGDSTTVITANITTGTVITDIIWSGDGGTFFCQNEDCESITVNTNVFSSYTVNVIDENGCTATDQININVSTQRNVYFPNVFNPNDFPPNDKFMILTGHGVEAVEYLRIFDRWGNPMFEAENLSHPTSTNDGWDGRRNFKEVEQGVYVFVAAVRFVDGQVIEYKGDITLIR